MTSDDQSSYLEVSMPSLHMLAKDVKINGKSVWKILEVLQRRDAKIVRWI